MKREMIGANVKCPTKELATRVCAIVNHFYPNRYDFEDGVPKFWKWYKEDTYFGVCDGSYGTVNGSGLDRELMTAEEFIKLNTNEEGDLEKTKSMKKEEIAVRIDTAEQAKRAYQILTDANEKIADVTKENLLKGNTYYKYLYWTGREWTRNNSSFRDKEITLDELEELLGVKKQEFKVGDRVNVISGANVSGYVGLGTICQFEDQRKFKVMFDNGDHTTRNQKGVWVYDDDSGCKFNVEHVTEPKQAEEPKTLSISRANLKRVYDIVCTGWQATITETIAKHNQFEDNILFDLAVVREGYSQANDAQVKLLKEVFPLPKVKKTVEVVRWVNRTVDGDEFIYTTEAEAMQKARTVSRDYQYVGAKLAGTAVIEERDEVEEGQELPF